MSTHLTRKELKQDNVALKVEETFDFFTKYRQQIVRGGIVAVALAAVVGGTIYYRNAQHEVREQMLADAMTLQAAPVGQAPANGGQSFATDAAKTDAVTKAYEKILKEHAGSDEAYSAEIALATMAADAGNLADARKKFQDVADHADAAIGSLAKLSLAQIDFAENNSSAAQAILKDLQDHPTELVSKYQAMYTLARGIAQSNPEEARKLLISIASSQSDIAQPATQALSELPSK
ncbi:MAG: tetratricopeptide repeat protein [Acidobacteriota bacterium]|nr:tetratricopeptide repeat protein [Acidobacteriota bacterium]